MRTGVLGLVLLSGLSVARAETVYFQVTCDPGEGEAEQQLGELAPNTLPPHLTFGSLEIKNTPESPLDEAIVFNTKGNDPKFFYDQLKFELDRKQNTYHLGFDVVAFGLKDSPNKFTVLMNTPYVSNFSLRGDGLVEPTGPNRKRIKQKYFPYEEGVPMRVDISLNFQEQRRVVLVDGQLVYDGPILPYAPPPKEPPGKYTPTDLRAVRFSLGLASAGDKPDHTTRVEVDNIVIDNGFEETAEVTSRPAGSP